MQELSSQNILSIRELCCLCDSTVQNKNFKTPWKRSGFTTDRSGHQALLSSVILFLTSVCVICWGPTRNTRALGLAFSSWPSGVLADGVARRPEGEGLSWKWLGRMLRRSGKEAGVKVVVGGQRGKDKRCISVLYL